MVPVLSLNQWVIMMLKRLLNQKCVYWEFKSEDREGNPIYENPIVLNCRIQESNNVIVDADGQQTGTNGTILTTQELKRNSCVTQGIDISIPRIDTKRILVSERGDSVSTKETLYRGVF